MPRKNKITYEVYQARIDKIYGIGVYTVYKNSFINIKHKVKVHCNIHNVDFIIDAHSFERGNTSCKKCIKEKQHKKQLLPWEIVQKRFIDAYGNKFSYDETTYDGIKKEMTVICNDCGAIFKITPEHHLQYNNGGCPNCSKTRLRNCSLCGKEIEVDKRVSLNDIVYCEECRKQMKRYKAKKYNNKNIEITKSLIEDKYICGSKELNELNIEISKRQSPVYFNKFIPFGMDITKMYTPEFVNEYNKVKDLLYLEYVINKLSPADIYKKYKCEKYINHSETLLHVFKDMNFPIRSHSESVANSWLLDDKYKNVRNGIRYQYKCGWYTTWDNKKVYLRSSYEFDYAQELDNQKIRYNVEFKRIAYFDTQKNKIRCAKPDFYIPETNTIIEIKSLFTLNIQNMKDRKKAYIEAGYNFKLICEHKELDIDTLNSNGSNSKLEELYKNLRNTKIHVGHEKWHWMNDGIQTYQVPISQIDEYLKRGFKHGRTIKDETSTTQ